MKQIVLAVYCLHWVVMDILKESFITQNLPIWGKYLCGLTLHTDFETLKGLAA
ncbi:MULTISPECIES: hypothetical protein [Xenorhabdus]|uniref:hypothetical protein n=1 Tax=Xenorhabdus TaxID=626 RepID=UPI001364BBD0|nr:MULTISPECIES: hypothetical protein [Xenorhabdus]